MLLPSLQIDALVFLFPINDLLLIDRFNLTAFQLLVTTID